METKQSKWLSLLFFLFGTLPFILLGLAAHPWGDDFTMAKMIQESSSIWAFTADFYHNWSGRFFGIFMSGLSPLNYGAYHLYSTAILLNMFAFMGATWYLFYKISQRWAGFNALLTTSVFLFVFNGILLNTAQYYYWLASSSMYLLSLALAMLLAGILITEKRTLPHWVFAPFLSLGVVASNEITMAAWWLFFGAYSLVKFRYYKLSWFEGFVGLLALAGSLTAIAAPGNFVRAEQLPNGFDFLFTLQSAAKASIYLLGYCFQSPSLWLALLLFLIKAPVVKSKWIEKSPTWLFILAFLAIPFLLYSLSYFALGGNPAWRIHNVIQFTFILSLIPLIMKIKTFLLHRQQTLPDDPILNAVLVVALLTLSLTDFSYKGEKDTGITLRNNIPQAIIDLTKASDYHKQMQKRHVQLVTNRGARQSIGINGINHPPKSIFMYDISENKDDISNKSLERYYDIQEICLKKED